MFLVQVVIFLFLERASEDFIAVHVT